MTNNSQILDAVSLESVTGGASFASIRAQGQQYCPKTTAKYADLQPSQVNRSVATKIGNECLAEMDPFTRSFARGRIKDAIDSSFPRR